MSENPIIDESGEDHEWWLRERKPKDGRWEYRVRNLSLPGPGEGKDITVPIGYLPIKGSIHPFYPRPRRPRT